MVSVVCVCIVSGGGGFLAVHRDVMPVNVGGECDVVAFCRGGGVVVGLLSSIVGRDSSARFH